MKNWVVKLLLLLLIPSILGVLFTVVFGSDTTVYMQLAMYICVPLLTLVFGKRKNSIIMLLLRFSKIHCQSASMQIGK